MSRLDSDTDETDREKALVERAFASGDVLSAVFDQSETGVYIVDRKRRILYWNSGAERITGYLTQEVMGEFCQNDLMMHCDANGRGMCAALCPMAATMLDGGPRETVMFVRHRRGHRLPVRMRSRAILGPDGHAIGAVEVFEALGAPQRTETSLLETYGCLDPLSNLANRQYGEMRLAHAIEALRVFNIPFGWLAVELDKIDELEHRFGHGVIDTAVKLIASTLDANVGALDLVSYWEPGEYRIECHSCWREGLAELAQKLVMLVRASNLEWWGDSRHVTVSIGGGVSLAGDTRQDLEARASAALALCRERGGNCALVHDGGSDLRGPGEELCLP